MAVAPGDARIRELEDALRALRVAAKRISAIAAVRDDMAIVRTSALLALVDAVDAVDAVLGDD